MVASNCLADYQGIKEMKFIDPKLGREIATWYNDAVSNLEDPETIEGYARLNASVTVAYCELVAQGWTFEAGTYPDSDGTDARPMLADLERKHLYYFPSTGGNPPNPLMSHAENERFRCVHDVLAHGAGRYSFSWQGETRAFLAHAVKLSSRLAMRALATETVGQNSWMNFVGGRYADQKAVLMPEDLLDKLLDNE